MVGLSFACVAVLVVTLRGVDAAAGAEDFISNTMKPESAVQVDQSVFVGSMIQDGGVAKYKLDGTRDSSWTPISGLPNVRGLAVNEAGNKLWAAHDNGVSEYTLESTGATKVTTYDTVGHSVTKPNGLCLNSDESLLFVTQPGWKAFPYGADGSNALLKVQLSDGTVTALFTDEEGHTPNGCTVVGDTIWMINQKDGITSFDYGTNTGNTQVAWAEAVKTYQADEFVGDGIVKLGDKFFVSSWKPMPRGGQIHVCEPSQGCKDFLAEVAADMQLGKSDEGPLLLLPNIQGGTVKIASLVHVDEDDRGDDTEDELVGDECEAACPGARAFAVAAMQAGGAIEADMGRAIMAGDLNRTDEAAMTSYWQAAYMEKLKGFCPHQLGLECMTSHDHCTPSDEATMSVQPLRTICGTLPDGNELVGNDCETACPGARTFAVAATQAGGAIEAEIGAAIMAGDLNASDTAAVTSYWQAAYMQKLNDFCPYQRGLECMASHDDCTPSDEAKMSVQPLRNICGPLPANTEDELVGDECETACPGARAFAVAAMQAASAIEADMGRAIMAGDLNRTDEAAMMRYWQTAYMQKLNGFCPHQLGLECMASHGACTPSEEALGSVQPLRTICGALPDGNELVGNECETACPGARSFAVAATQAADAIEADMGRAIMAGDLDRTDEAAMQRYWQTAFMEKLNGFCPFQTGLECMVSHDDCTPSEEATGSVGPLRQICGTSEPPRKGNCVTIPRATVDAIKRNGWTPKICND